MLPMSMRRRSGASASAGTNSSPPTLRATVADFDRVIGVNLRGAFVVGREALRLMVAAGSGQVVNIASELAYVGTGID